MADITYQAPRPWWDRIDRVWAAFALILAGVAVATPGDFFGVVESTGRSLTHTGVFILFAVTAVAYLRATGAERLLSRAFQGSEVRMIVLGALMGGLAPFCSCEVIPFIAAMLAVGVPLSAVMAFWLASPLMDPAMFMITAGALGVEFAIAKTVAAVGIGMFGGAMVSVLARSAVFADPLKETAPTGCGCGVKKPFTGAPVWQFWREADRRASFGETWTANAKFLLKWLALAYLIEALMVRHLPAEWVAGVLGGEGPLTVVLAALVGGPAYMNGYAAVPLIGGLMEQGMSGGAAMAFMIAGGISSIPAMMAVWPLVKARVFASYLGFAFVGSVAAGLIFGVIA